MCKEYSVIYCTGFFMASSSLQEQGESTCFGIKFVPRTTTKMATEIKFSDIYAVELAGTGIIQKSNLTSAVERFLGNDSHDSKV